MQLIACDREALDLSNEEVKAVSGFSPVSPPFFLSLHISIYLSRLRPEHGLGLDVAFGLMFP